MMRAANRVPGPAEASMRAQILAVLPELCRDATLQDVREWYLESLVEPHPLPASGTGAPG
jgi:hypothetical protein